MLRQPPTSTFFSFTSRLRSVCRGVCHRVPTSFQIADIAFGVGPAHFFERVPSVCHRVPATPRCANCIPGHDLSQNRRVPRRVPRCAPRGCAEMSAARCRGRASSSAASEASSAPPSPMPRGPPQAFAVTLQFAVSANKVWGPCHWPSTFVKAEDSGSGGLPERQVDLHLSF